MTTATVESPTARVAALRETIAGLQGRSTALASELEKASYSRRPAIREELTDIDQQLRAARAQLPPLVQAADVEQMAAADRANRLAGARRLLAGLQDDVERARTRAGAVGSAASRDPWTDIVRSVERARAQLRAAGEPVADRITIEL